MEQQIIAGLMQRGLSEAQAKGIVANMIVESDGLQPGVNEYAPVVPGSRGGYGLNQWTGPRRRQFEAFAAERGAALDDVNTQLDFTMWELQNTERNAFNALQGAQTPMDAARIYSEQFLRPGIPNSGRRMAEAERLAGLSVNALAGGQGFAPQQPGQPPMGNALAQAEQPQFQWRDMAIDPAPFMNRNALRRT